MLKQTIKQGETCPAKVHQDPRTSGLGAEGGMEPEGLIVSLDTGVQPNLSAGCSFGHLNMGTTSNYWCVQRRVNMTVKSLEGENQEEQLSSFLKGSAEVLISSL